MRFPISSNTDIQSVLDQTHYLCQQHVTTEHIRIEVVTIVSELVYNIVKYTVGGVVSIEHCNGSFVINADDEGSGFKPSLSLALQEGFSTGNSLGLGIPSLVRLADELDLESSEQGTSIQIKKYIQ